MPNIKITQKDKIIAHHTTESYLSHYGQPVWVIENANPESGPAVFEESEADILVEIEIIGVIDGWLVIKQPPTEKTPQLLAGIIWSDGNYFGNLIQTRAEESLVEDADIDALKSGKFMVKGTIAVNAFDGNSSLGCVFSS